MVVPVDADIDETQYVAQEDRDQRQECLEGALTVTAMSLTPALGTMTGEFTLTSIVQKTTCGGAGGTVVTLPRSLNPGQLGYLEGQNGGRGSHWRDGRDGDGHQRSGDQPDPHGGAHRDVDHGRVSHHGR